MLQVLVSSDCFTNIFLSGQKYSEQDNRIWHKEVASLVKISQLCLQNWLLITFPEVTNE